MPDTTCMRCPYVRPRRATVQRSFMLAQYPDEQYDLNLCDVHGAQFDREQNVWATVADVVEVEPTTVRPTRAFRSDSRRRFGDDSAARIRALKEKANAGRTPTVVKEDDRDVLIGPSHDQWLFTIHAQERAKERGFNVQDVLKAAANPHTTAPSSRKDSPNVFYHVTNDCCAVVDRKRKMIVTVYTKFQYLCKAANATTKGIA